MEKNNNKRKHELQKTSKVPDGAKIRRLQPSMTIDLEITIQDIDIESVKDLIKEVRPHWKIENCHHRVFSKGITNSSAVYYIGDFKEPFVIRQNGELSDKFVDRKKEILAFKRLADAKICPPLIATFRNGVIMEYFRGKMLNDKNIADKAVAKDVAQEIAKMHRDVKLLPTEIDEDIVRQTSDFINLLPEKFSKASVCELVHKLKVRTKQELLAELEIARNLISKQSTPLVFCHNDMLPDNMLYEEDIRKVNIIDFEYQSPNPAAFDIAEHFNEYAGLELDFSIVPKKDYMTWWLKEYLMVFKNSENIHAEEISRWVESVKLMMPLSHLYWGTWSLMQAELSTIDFEYVSYAHKRIEEYFRLKNEILEASENSILPLNN